VTANINAAIILAAIKMEEAVLSEEQEPPPRPSPHSTTKKQITDASTDLAEAARPAA
jgi:hypothetical protein